MPGAIVALILILTIKEPIRGQSEQVVKRPVLNILLQERIFELLKIFLCPSMFLLCIAGGIRNGGGYVWATNTELFFENVKDQTSGQISIYMSWIPLVGGSLGVLFGGLISDRFVKKSGPHGRVWVLVVSQLAATPFAVGALLLDPPWCYLSLIPSNVIGEMWVSVTMTVVIELVPVYLRISCVAVYFFIITNIGGNVNPLVSVIKNGLGGTNEDFKFALLIMYPGLYLLGGLLFLLTIFVLKWDLKRARAMETERLSLIDNKKDDYDSTNERSSSIQAQSSEHVQQDC
jgi:MFS family permease